MRGLDPEAQASAWVIAWPAQQPNDAEDRPSAALRVPVGDEGKYRLEGIEPGSYYVSAIAKEYETRYYDDAVNVETATAVEVGENETVESIDLTLVRYGTGEGSIEGRVVADFDGTPIAGATLHAFSPDNPYSYGVSETDEAGHYAMAGLRTGSYVLEVVHPQYLPEFYGDATAYDQAVLVEVVEPDPTRGIDFGLRKGGSISGVVLDTEGLPVAGAYVNGSLIFDRNPPPTADATPSAGSTSDFSRPDAGGVDATEADVAFPVYGGWAVTDSSGAYHMGGLVTGDYRVQAQSSARWVYASTWYDGAESYDQATAVAVVTGAETSGIDMRLDLPVTESAVTGRVTDTGGHPVAGAFVVVQDTDWTRVVEAETDVVTRIWANATTDEDGRYRIEELPAGSFTVSAETEGGWEYVQRWYVDAESAQEATVVDLAEGEQLGSIDITLPVRVATASISGVVRDQNGQPVPAFIEIRPAPTSDGTQPARLWAYGNADDEGHYRVDRLPAGAYTVHASYRWEKLFGHGWFDGADSPETGTSVLVADGQTQTDIDFQLDVRPIYGAVAGVVTDAGTGEAVSRAYVVLNRLARDAARSAPLPYWNPGR